MKRILSLLAVLTLAIGLAACSSSSKKSSPPTSGSSGTAANITIQNLTFNPTPVKAGSTVTVKNMDGFEHTVTSDDGTSFNISVPGGSTQTFTAPAKAGSYKFHCNIHSSMHGTLTVTA
jgi:plastocyanin